MAKRFFYGCAGILCLVIAYHLGANNATAQTEGKGRIRHVVCWENRAWLVTDADDIFSINRDSLQSVARGTGWAKYKIAGLNY